MRTGLDGFAPPWSTLAGAWASGGAESRGGAGSAGAGRRGRDRIGDGGGTTGGAAGGAAAEVTAGITGGAAAGVTGGAAAGATGGVRGGAATGVTGSVTGGAAAGVTGGLTGGAAAGITAGAAAGAGAIGPATRGGSGRGCSRAGRAGGPRTCNTTPPTAVTDRTEAQNQSRGRHPATALAAASLKTSGATSRDRTRHGAARQGCRAPCRERGKDVVVSSHLPLPRWRRPALEPRGSGRNDRTPTLLARRWEALPPATAVRTGRRHACPPVPVPLSHVAPHVKQDLRLGVGGTASCASRSCAMHQDRLRRG